MNTRDRYAFTYGKISIRAQLPYGKGIWPALWMLGTSFTPTSGTKSGEIDIMELVGGGVSGDYTMYCAIHYDDNGYAHNESGPLWPLKPGEKFHDDFHVFELEKTTTDLTFRLDGNYLWTISIDSVTQPERSEFQLPFFLIMNIAVGGKWPGNPDATTVFPQTMLVDWVRYYQWTGSGSPPPPATPTPRPNHIIVPLRQYSRWNDEPSLSLVYVFGVPTETTGLNIRTLVDSDKPWVAGVHWPTIVSVRTTDVLQLSFYARKLSPAIATVIRTHVLFEENYDPYTRSLSETSFLGASTSWALFTWTFSPVSNYRPGNVSVKLLLGYGPQEFEVTDVILVRN